MDEHVVTTKAALIAALKAAAQPSFDLARARPFKVTLGKCVYNFEGGLHERRMQSIVRKIRATPARAFNTDARDKELL